MYFKIKMILLAIFSINLFANDLEIEKIFKNKEVEGTMVIESLNQNKSYIYNKQRAETFLSPASSFKIPHTLIALNEGIINKDSVILWDKKIREIDSWNQNQTLQTAFKNSCVWCYKEFTSKISVEKYKEYLKAIDYGNKKIGKDISDFWLDGSLQITTYGQMKFLKRLYENDLPFKIEDMDLVKEIMIEEQNEEYTLRSKTGWSTSLKSQSGWYIGYVETKDDVWFFATNIITKGQKDLEKRKKITLEALKIEGIIK